MSNVTVYLFKAAHVYSLLKGLSLTVNLISGALTAREICDNNNRSSCFTKLSNNSS